MQVPEQLYTRTITAPLSETDTVTAAVLLSPPTAKAGGSPKGAFLMTAEQSKLFAVVYNPDSRKPYIIRTKERVFEHSRKSGADRSITALLKAGYLLDITGQTGASLTAAQEGNPNA